MRTRRAARRAIRTPRPGTVTFWGLMAVVALAPLPLGANRPWAWSLLALLAALLALGWALAALRRPSLAPLSWRRHGFVTVPFLAVVAWALFQAASLAPAAWHHPLWREAGAALGRTLAGAISVDPDATAEGAMRILAYGVVFWLAMQLGRDTRRARLAVWTVAVAGLGYAVYGIAAQIGPEPMVLWYPKWAYPGSLTSTFVNRNSYAVQAGLALLAMLALLGETMRDIAEYPLLTRFGISRALESLSPQAFFLIAAAAATATALVLTGSRGGLAASVAAIMTLALALGLRRGAARGGIALALAALGGGLAILAISGGLTLGRMEIALGAASGRDAVHALARDMIADRPFLGHGLGTFPELFRLYRDGRFAWIEPVYLQAHSTYLELGAELGIAAAAVLVGICVAIAVMCLIGALRRRRARIYPCLGLAASALVGLQALFDFAVQTPAVAVTYLVLAGVGFAQSYRTEDGLRASNDA